MNVVHPKRVCFLLRAGPGPGMLSVADKNNIREEPMVAASNTALADDRTLIERILNHIDHKTTDMSDRVWHEPVVHYTSKDRFDAEITKVLRRTPTPFCPSAALVEVGSYVAREA